MNFICLLINCVKWHATFDISNLSLFLFIAENSKMSWFEREFYELFNIYVFNKFKLISRLLNQLCLAFCIVLLLFCS